MIRRFLPLTIIASIFFFVACQKEGELDATNTNGFLEPGSGNFQAKIDGVQWSANEVITATIQNGVIVIYGSNTDQKSMLLRVGDSGVHNYTFTNNSTSNVGAFTDSTLTPVAAFTTNGWDIDSTYGNLNITSIDTTNKVMSGTFSMKVYRQIDSLQRNITEGVFTNVPYTTQPAPTSGTDTFRVKIDGADFSYDILSGISAFGQIHVSASQGGVKSVGITVPDDAPVGVDTFDLSEYVGQYNVDASTFLGADSGSLTILEHNTTTHRIRGSFDFRANTVFTHLPPVAHLTEGYFSVIYQ